MVNCVSILGATGSIGRQSLDIISRLPEIRVAALTAGTSVDRMAQQCRQFLPELAVMATQEAAEQLSQEIKDLPIRVNWGEAGLIEAATVEKADCVIILFTFSCSQVVSKDHFRTAVFTAAAQSGRRVRILHQLHQPADHPINIYHPEGEYLKGLVLYVE